MELWISGGAWITSEGYGTLSEEREINIGEGEPVIPEAKELFDEPLQRYGRFDSFTRLGCAATALALRDADMAEKQRKDDTTGMIISSDYEILNTDIDYYETTLDAEGAFSSPNLFSYTLPVIVLGECAVYYGLTGPTFCVGDDALYGLKALESAAAMIAAGKAQRMIVGWLESPPERSKGIEGEMRPSGAVFIVLDAIPAKILFSKRKLSYGNNVFKNHKNQKITSLMDVFARENER
ncbi:MAG: hypothetical protein IME96_03630 [Proteobacteria bacterium]|nr:hypothetical protein [Pseudomonadota bacterium]